MKKSMNHIFGKLGLLFIVSLAILSSCQDSELEPISTGTPVIKKVYLLDTISRHKDSTFVSTIPDDKLLVINGENLGGIIKVYFNDYEASFNTNYNTNTHLIIRLPKEAPTEATMATVSNKLRIVTSHGEVSYDFLLLPPPPNIYWIDNENALPGATITIHGANFLLVQKVVFPGNIEVTDFKATKEGDKIEVKVPANLTLSGALQVVTKYGISKTVAPFNLNSGASVFANFDDKQWANWMWNIFVKNSTTDYPGAHGSYAYFEKNTVTKAGDNAWWNADGRALWLTTDLRNPLMSKDSLTNRVEHFSLKFEINVKQAWASGAFLIKANGKNYAARYEPWRAAGKAFSTQGWVTQTIPLTDFRTADGTGTSATSISDILGADGNNGGAEFVFFFDNTTPQNSDIDKIAMAVDNLRIVRTTNK